MKTVKFISAVFLFSLCMASFGQDNTSSVKMNTYFVQIPHNPEQCMKQLDEIKGKNDALFSKLEFGCKYGDHTAYGFLQGKSVEDVRMMLPKDDQASAKIQEVGKFTDAQLAELHKQQGDNMKK